VVLIVILGLLRTPPLVPETRASSLLTNIREGASFIVHRRPLIWQLMTLDLSATVFGAYRVVLPALAVDYLHVGAAGYGVLSAAPSAGALLSTYVVFRVVGTSRRLGRVLLWASVAYGFAVVLLGQSSTFWLALVAGALIGGCDAMATTIRHAAVQLVTPDELRGRVSSLYGMSSRGGPALGDVNMGWVAGVLGPPLALTVGGLVSVIYAVVVLVRGGRVRDYRGAEEPEDEGPLLVEPPDAEELGQGDPLTPPREGRRAPG
jgi:hypothetical protein